MSNNYIILGESAVIGGGPTPVLVTGANATVGETIVINSDGVTASWGTAGGGSATPSGPAGGDLGGIYPNPTVLSVAHVTTGVLPAANQAAQTLTGDVTGNTGANTVVTLTGVSSVVNFPTAATTATIGQASESSATQGANLTIKPQQSTQATNNGGGNLTVSLQTPAGTGTHAYVDVQEGGVSKLQLGNSIGIFTMPTILSSTSLLLQSTSGGIFLEGGASGIYLDGTGGVNYRTSSGANQYLTIANGTVTWSNSSNAPSTTQTVLASGSTASATGTAGSTMSFTAQAGQTETGTTSVGGAGGVLTLSSGAGGTGTSTNGVAGVVKLQAGGTTIQGVDGSGAFVAQQSAVSVATTGTVALTAAQAQNPYIILSGTLTGNVTVTLPSTVSSGTTRVWYFDINAVVFAAHTLTFSIGSGSTTASITSLTTNSNILTLFAPSNNVCYLNL